MEEAWILMQGGPFYPQSAWMFVEQPAMAMPERPARVSPEQLVQVLSPLTYAAGEALRGGAPVGSVLREFILAGFLVGAGMAPVEALELVGLWRSAGVSPGSGRGEAGEGREHPAPAPAKSYEPLLRSMETAMRDELTASEYYGALRDIAEGMPLREKQAVVAYIDHARADEQKHLRILTELYRALSGRVPEVKPERVEFEGLADGLRKAMEMEYEAFEEYRRLYLDYPEERFRRVFFLLLTDELEHATRFNYALQTLAG